MRQTLNRNAMRATASYRTTRVSGLTQNPRPPPRPLPRPLPLGPPLPIPPRPPLMPPVLAPRSCSFLALFFGFGVSSINSVSSGSESGRMKYLISDPRMLIWSRLICEPPFGVILAVRREVFICGETDAMVPCTMVPATQSIWRIPRMVFERSCVPVLSSIVTDSFVHFIKNLPYLSARLFRSQPWISSSARDTLG